MEWFQNNERTIEEVSIAGVMNAVKDSHLQLPLYQRDLIWSEGQISCLWDSLLRGFPLPSFMVVRGNDNNSSRSLAKNGMRTETIAGNNTWHYDVLDGQQRLSAIITGYNQNDTSIRLWIDLSPPRDKNDPQIIKNHPLKFRFWIHPCTRIFPFGFRMEASGEHDFHPMHDDIIYNDLWGSLQETQFAHMDYFQIPLSDTFPWKASCPVPLDELLALSNDEITQENFPKCLENIVNKSREKVLELYGQKFFEHLSGTETKPDNEVVVALSKGLNRIKNAKLALQLVDLDGIGLDEDAGYTFFERIGRGGVPITQRQLAVSRIMLELGCEGNNALVGFQNSAYGKFLETEDIIHALTRVALAETKPSGEQAEDDIDMLELNTVNLQKIKKVPQRWADFRNKLSEYCEKLPDNSNMTKIGKAFKEVFDLLRYDPCSNQYGFPLVQLAHFSRNKEGINPITIHPILLYMLKDTHKKVDLDYIKDDMLRWILFANGFVSDPKNNTLNRKAFEFMNLSKTDFFDQINNIIFTKKGNNKLRNDLGFKWNEPKIAEDGTVGDYSHEFSAIPKPSEVLAMTSKHLILNNSDQTGVNKFILMWNQREGLHKMYGDTPVEHILALFGKGRPFDVDHIIARSCLLYKGEIGQNILKSGCATFFKETEHSNKYFMKDWFFRKCLPNLNGNFRYWPKRLNRADSNCLVKNKMPIKTIIERLKSHPLSDRFENALDCIPWEWSAIDVKNQNLWESLPPIENKWDAELVERFIRLILEREFVLYGNAYMFLTDTKYYEKFSCNGIV